MDGGAWWATGLQSIGSHQTRLSDFKVKGFHTVKGFGIISKAEVDVFLELSCFFNDPADVGNLILVPLPFLNPA